MKEDVKHVAAPVVIVPYVWIGDFVRCHSVVKLLRAKNPDRPIDIVSSTLCAPLADYMPGVRRAVVIDLPRGNRCKPVEKGLRWAARVHERRR